jgi:ribosomal protein S18 acetylase RimI-like enzyme
MEVARLAPKHAVEYRALMLEAYDQHPSAFTSSSAERATLPLSWWQRRLSGEPAAPEVVFGARRNGTLAGAAGLVFEQRSKGRHKATLLGMYVRPQFRRRGLARALVAAALDHARGVPHVLLVQLTVTQGNDAARALYESFGFVAFGVEPYAVAVGGAFVSKVHMWCKLKAIEEPLRS